MQTIQEALKKLDQSHFRSSFHLKEADCKYIDEKGWDVIQTHCEQFVQKRLAPAVIDNDGSQTPMRGAPKGHPVFLAQHACACCCRGCLSKWYHVTPGVELSEIQQQKIVRLLMAWIKKEYHLIRG